MVEIKKSSWFKLIAQLVPDLKKLLLKALLFSLIIEMLKLIPPYVMKEAIDLLVGAHSEFTSIALAISGVLIASLITTFIEDRFIQYAADVSFLVRTEILKRAQKKLLSLGLSYHEEHPSGDSLHLVNDGATRVQELTWFLQDQFMGASLQAVLTSISLILVNPLAGLLFTLFLPLSTYMAYKSAVKLQPYRERYHNLFREASWSLNESLFNIRTVKNFVQEKKEHQAYSLKLDQYLQLAHERIHIENVETCKRDIVLGVGRFSVLLYAGYLVFNGQMTTGTLVLFMTLSEKANASLYRIGRLYALLGDSVESVSQLLKIFAEKIDITSPIEPHALPAELKGEVAFNNVSFTYQSAKASLNQENPPALVDINLNIPARKFTALVGRSGAGKSTVTKLILRHYDPTLGNITLDGIDIRDFTIADYRSVISIVSQDIEIFDRTVNENIAYGRSATEAEIVSAAKQANAHDFIMSLPNGYQTRLGERGIKLSGGQKQRLGIARALITNPSVLIFDEATSSLDSEAEFFIQDAIYQLFSKCTIIMIAHRLSTIAKADMIVVFDNGRIIESGSRLELLGKDNSNYRRMLELQDPSLSNASYAQKLCMS